MLPDHALTCLREWEGYQGQIAHSHVIPPKAPTFGSIAEGLQPAIQTLLPPGVGELYSHQSVAIQNASQGNHVILSTATASGKTLALALPGQLARMQRQDARLLCVVPTRALAEQWRQLLTGWAPSASVETYTGDTPKNRRAAIRGRVHWLVTTPDMLHMGLLPYHMGWHTFLKDLRYVIVDETHVYRGAFGSHIAHVLRRLRRVAQYHGAPTPTFLFASATIGNPSEHATELLGLPVTAITESGVPSGSRSIALWQPPDMHGHSDEAAVLMAVLLELGIRTILFGQARQSVERILREVRFRLPPELGDRVEAYRAGYKAEERRLIERRLSTGELLGVVTTNALELGIDIGSLDASIIDGFPGSVSSFWQHAGRAGRGEGSACTILVLRQDALDQYFATHPEQLLASPVEHARVNLNNRYILPAHLICAAHEKPIAETELDMFGISARAAAADLASKRQLFEMEGQYRALDGSDNPAMGINLRQAGGRVSISNALTGERIEETDSYHAALECYPGAVYISQGQIYVVLDLDLVRGEVRLEPRAVDYYTDPLSNREVAILQEQDRMPSGDGSSLYTGQVQVTEHVVGFVKKAQRSRVLIGAHELERPLTLSLDTVGLWVTVPDNVITGLIQNGHDPAGSLHAAEHALIALLPLFVLGDRRDIGGVSILPAHHQTGQATIFIYDGYPGGIGYAEEAFRRFRDLATATREAVAACPCEEGCYACVQSPKCGNENRPLDKAGAVRLVGELLQPGKR